MEPPKERHEVRPPVAVVVALASILAITIIEIVALAQRIDGVMMTLGIGALAGIAGFSVRDILPRISK